MSVFCWRIGGAWRSRMTLPSGRTAVSGSHATVNAAQLDALMMLAQAAQNKGITKIDTTMQNKLARC